MYQVDDNIVLLDPPLLHSSAAPSGAENPSASIPDTSPVPQKSVDWDGWPDGSFERTFTSQEVQATKILATNWACQVSGSSSGSDEAENWRNGRKLERRCRGIISCSNVNCKILIRPCTRMNEIERQLEKSCICGSSLVRSECRALQVLMRFRHGIHFIHRGFHSHPRPTHILHLTSRQRDAFVSLVEQNPTAGPLQLLVGVPGLNGPGSSAADISSVLHNKDRISHELKNVRRGTQRAGNAVDDLNIGEFSQFCAEYPGFIIHSVIRDIVVISMQQPLMLSELVKNTPGTEQSVNGIVSDAAHGFWKQRNCLLVISSAYSWTLRAWVPGILSYTNGATSDHYRYHFLALFQSIARERRARGWDTSSDHHFGNV